MTILDVKGFKNINNQVMISTCLNSHCSRISVFITFIKEYLIKTDKIKFASTGMLFPLSKFDVIAFIANIKSANCTEIKYVFPFVVN